MSDVFENKGALAATIVVAASNSLNKGQANYVCDGVQDNVEIQAALTAGAGGKVLLLEGTYNCTANLLVPASTTLEGQGFGTILNFTGAAITNAITINGHNVHVRNLKGQLAAGAGAGGSRPNIVYANTKNLIWLENLWLVGDTSVADDGTDSRQCGIFLFTCSYSKIVNCQSQTNTRHGIRLEWGSYHTISGNTCTGNTRSGISLGDVYYTTVSSNVCENNSQQGISLEASSNWGSIAGNICKANGQYGIYASSICYDAISNNVCTGNTRSGIYLSGGYDNTVSNNICESNTRTGIDCSSSFFNILSGNVCRSNGAGVTKYSGIRITSSDETTITGNLCQANGLHGIEILKSLYCIVTGNCCFDQITGDGINITGDGTRSADYNTLTVNICRTNASNGVEIAGAANANKNKILGNQLFGNTGLALNDAGVLTEVESDNTGIEITDIKIYRRVKNTSGAQRVAGDVVSLKAVAAGNELTAPAAIGEPQVYGMVAETINDTAWGLVQVKGKTTVLKGTNAGGGDIAIGDNLITENGVRARKAAATTDPIFARALEALAAADGVIDAYILSPWD